MNCPNICIDCGKLICSVSTRCKSCSNKNRAGKFHWSKEARQRISGSRNHNWKGNDVGLVALHEWINNHKPTPKLCERCGENPPMDLANISGKYKRDINDYQYLCRRCHMEIDGRLERLHR